MEWSEIAIGVVAGVTTIGSLVIGWRSRRFVKLRWPHFWARVATEQGFSHRVVGMTRYDRDGARVTLLGDWDSVWVIRGELPEPLPPNLSIELGDGGGSWQTGDEVFDRRVEVRGDEAAGRALLSHPLREVLPDHLHEGLTIERGRVVRVHPAEGMQVSQLNHALEEVCALMKLLIRCSEGTVPARLAHNSDSDLRPLARLENLRTLLLRYPESPEAVEAASYAEAVRDPLRRAVVMATRSPPDVDGLRTLLEDASHSAETRAGILGALRHLDPEAVGTVIRPLLQTPGTEPAVVAAAARLMVATGAAGLLAELTSHASRPHAELRREIVRACGVLESVEREDVLWKVLDGRGDDAERRGLTLLFDMATQRSLPHLAEYVPHPTLAELTSNLRERLRGRFEALAGGLSAPTLAPEDGGLSPATPDGGLSSPSEPADD